MLGITLMFSQCRQQPPVDDGSQPQIPYNKEKAQVHIISIKTAAQYVTAYKVGRLDCYLGQVQGGDALPEAGGEKWVAVAGKIFPLGVEGLKLWGGHGGVLGGVEATAELTGHVGEALEEGEALIGLDREV